MASDQAKIPLVINKGSTLDEFFIWSTGTCETDLVPVDLTGCDARLHVRATPDDPTVLLALSTADSTIVLNEVPGKVRYHLAAAQTLALDWEGTPGYDLEITFPNGTVVHRVYGPVTLNERYTHD